MLLAGSSPPAGLRHTTPVSVSRDQSNSQILSSSSNYLGVLASPACLRSGDQALNYMLARLPRVHGTAARAAFSELKQRLVKHNRLCHHSFLTSINPDDPGPQKDPSLSCFVTPIMRSQALAVFVSTSIRDVRLFSLRNAPATRFCPEPFRSLYLFRSLYAYMRNTQHTQHSQHQQDHHSLSGVLHFHAFRSCSPLNILPHAWFLSTVWPHQ